MRSFFQFCLYVVFVSILLSSCQERPKEVYNCDQDTVIYDRYINQGLGFSIRIPLNWDTISDMELKEWENLGRSLIDSTSPFIPAHNLVALQHRKDNKKGVFKINCVAQAKFPQFRNADDFTNYNQQIMDSSFAHIGVKTHSSIEERNIGDLSVNVLYMYLYTNSLASYRMEFINLYHKGHIVMISSSYDNELDSIELYRTIETLKVEE